MPPAQTLLREAVRFEDREPLARRLLAIAHGKSNFGVMALALAEQAMAEGDCNMARQRAQNVAADARRRHD